MKLPIARHGALKQNETSYIRVMGYAAGKLEYNPLAVLSADTPVIVIVAHDNANGSMLHKY